MNMTKEEILVQISLGTLSIEGKCELLRMAGIDFCEVFSWAISGVMLKIDKDIVDALRDDPDVGGYIKLCEKYEPLVEVITERRSPEVIVFDEKVQS